MPQPLPSLEALAFQCTQLAHSVDVLAQLKASRRELDLLADALQFTARRIDDVESRCTQLNNRIEVIMHTTFPLDPATLREAIAPLVERIEMLECLALSKDRLARNLAQLALEEGVSNRCTTQ
jgi:uncharacterized protein YPO0396